MAGEMIFKVETENVQVETYYQKLINPPVGTLVLMLLERVYF
jgi:hypothetical protein